MPRPRCHIFVCQKERPADSPKGSCVHNGSKDILARLRAECKTRGLADVLVTKSGCLDQCGIGPTVVVHPDGVWYTGVRPEDVSEIVTSHIQGGKPVERLRLPDSAWD